MVRSNVVVYVAQLVVKLDDKCVIHIVTGLRTLLEISTINKIFII